jgi:Fur family transcriptional regulator, peroxide stress response regulator
MDKPKEAQCSFRESCARAGLKVTPQRSVIYEELVKSRDHPGAEVIYSRVKKILPNISFDTVYRTLLSFYNAGIVGLAEGYAGMKRFEPDLSGHHHFCCVKCNALVDFYDETYDRVRVPDKFKKGFLVLTKRVVLYGVCSKCGKVT